MVPRAGLEPARIAPHAPQTCAATNYATSAKTLNCKELFIRRGRRIICSSVRFKLVGRRRFDQCTVAIGVDRSIRSCGLGRGLGRRLRRGFCRCISARSLKDRNASAKSRHRDQKRGDHKHGRRGDRQFRKNRRRASRPVRRARNVAREQRSRVGFARLQQDRSDKHDAGYEKQCVQNIKQNRYRPTYL